MEAKLNNTYFIGGELQPLKINGSRIRAGIEEFETTFIPEDFNSAEYFKMVLPYLIKIDLEIDSKYVDIRDIEALLRHNAKPQEIADNDIHFQRILEIPKITNAIEFIVSEQDFNVRNLIELQKLRDGKTSYNLGENGRKCIENIAEIFDESEDIYDSFITGPQLYYALYDSRKHTGVNAKSARLIWLWYLIKNKHYALVSFYEKMLHVQTKSVLPYYNNKVVNMTTGTINLYEDNKKILEKHREMFEKLKRIQNVSATDVETLLLYYSNNIKPAEITTKLICELYNSHNYYKNHQELLLSHIEPLVKKGIIDIRLTNAAIKAAKRFNKSLNKVTGSKKSADPNFFLTLKP